MKTILRNKIAIIFCMFISVVFASCWHDTISMSVHNSRYQYRFYASYNIAKTENVEEYLKEKGIDLSEDDDNGTTVILHDDTKFYVKSSPGLIKILLNKKENTEAAYKRVKHICDELKEVVQ